MTLHFEDFAVGQIYRTARLRVTEDEITAFAERFDPQPFHLDDTAARATIFGGLAASGWHTAALSMRLLVEGEFRPAGGIIGGGGELAWPRPVRPGDELRVESEILSLRPSKSRPGFGVVQARNTTLNQASEPVQVFTVHLSVPLRAHA
jgi:acyl dehydratase